MESSPLVLRRVAAGPLAGAAVYLALSASELTYAPRALAGVLSCAVVWWLLEAMPLALSAILASCLCVVLKIGDARAVLAPYAHPVIFLFLGSFWIAKSMELHGLDRRIALGILSLPSCHSSPRRLLAALAAASGFISMWVSNTATTAMLLPIVLGILEAIPEDSRPEGFDAKMLLMLAFAASVGGIGTPVGTPPNLIGIAQIDRALGIKISFAEWTALAAPLAAVVLAALVLGMGRGLRAGPGWSRLSAHFERERRSEGRWSDGERHTLLAFLAAVGLWLFAPLEEGVSAVLAASLLFVLPAGGQESRQATLSWDDAARIDWGTLLLFGGGMSLGALMFETKLAEWLGSSVVQALGLKAALGVSFASGALALFTSEIASNTASANVAVPVAIALSRAAGVEPVMPAVTATLASSFGFLLPVSTPPNAIVYGTGRIPLKLMARYGLALDLFGFLLVWLAVGLLSPIWMR